MSYLVNIKGAELSTRKAIEINPKFVEAKIHLESLIRKDISRWHIPMINDHERNKAYSKAIKLAVKENDYVLEIGTGSGLLSMMAIDAGAKKVITCEPNESISELAKKIITKNGSLSIMASSITTPNPISLSIYNLDSALGYSLKAPI